MEERIYIIMGILMKALGTSSESIVFTSGAIEGEVDANNWRKWFSTQHPNLYIRMVEIPRANVMFWQGPIDNVLAKSAR